MDNLPTFDLDHLWFTSDIHIGHYTSEERNILRYSKRPFATIDEMAEEIARRWNAVVQPKDVVIILGDMAMGMRDETLPFFRRLNGFFILVPGNHDHVWEHGHHSLHTWEPKYRELAKVQLVVQPPTKLELDGIKFVLTHMPDTADEDAADHTAAIRYAKYRPAPPNDDEIMLAGHVHEAWKIRGRRINVGMDQWDFTPVAAREILRTARDIMGGTQ